MPEITTKAPASPVDSVEEELLLLAAHPGAENADGTWVRRLVLARPDWAHVLWIAHRHGTLPLLHLLFGLLFIGVLCSMLRSAAGPTGAVYTAVIGGAVFLALTAAGLAAEVAVPAAIVRFDDVTVTDYAQPYLGLAVWLYHYSHIGSAALIFATAYIVWRTGVLPRWSAALAVK